MNNKRIFFLIFNIFLINYIYCFDINSVATDSIKKDTIRAKFKITSIQKVQGFSLFECEKCTFRHVKTLDIYYKNNESAHYYYRRRGYIRKAYYITAELQDKNAECQIYHILSFKEPRERKKESEKIKIGEVYDLKVIEYPINKDEMQYISSNTFVTIDGIEFDLWSIMCGVLIPFNLGGLYYY